MIQIEVAQLLGAAVDGLAYSETTDEGNVFVDNLPSTPDRAVAVYAAGGSEPDSKLPYDPVDIMVIVRSEASGTWARTIWERIYSTLQGRRNQALPGGTWLVSCLAVNAGPIRLGADENGRQAYSVSYRLEVLNTTSQRS